MTNFLSEVQPQKQLSPIAVTDVGITMPDNDVQFEKADLQITSTELGMIIWVNDEQPQNEHFQ